MATELDATQIATAPVFLHGSRGGAWPTMVRHELAHDPVFRAALEQLDPVVQRALGWSCIDELGGPGSRRPIDEERYIEPVLACVQLASARSLIERGVEPAATLALSSGEGAALVSAGALAPEHAVTVACAWSRLARPAASSRMLAVFCDHDSLAAIVEERPSEIDVTTRYTNAVCVAAGPAEDLADLVAELERRQIGSTYVPGAAGWHSRVVDSVRAGLWDLLADVRGGAPTIPAFTTIWPGGAHRPERIDVEHWWQVARARVNLWGAIEAVFEAGYRSFMEVGPGVVLLKVIAQFAVERGIPVELYAALHPDHVGTLVRFDAPELCRRG